MRLRVEIPIDQPLMRGMNISLEGGKGKWVRIKYEKLPYYCYKCGLVGHRFRDCELHLDNEDCDSDSEKLSYPKSLEVQIFRKNCGIEGSHINGGGRNKSDVESEYDCQRWTVDREAITPEPKFWAEIVDSIRKGESALIKGKEIQISKDNADGTKDRDNIDLNSDKNSSNDLGISHIAG